MSYCNDKAWLKDRYYIWETKVNEFTVAESSEVKIPFFCCLYLSSWRYIQPVAVDISVLQ